MLTYKIQEWEHSGIDTMSLVQGLIILSVIPALFCLLSVWVARTEQYPPYARVRDATTLGAGGVEDGSVLVAGTATRGTGTVRSLLGDEALCAVSAIYEYESMPSRAAGWHYAAYRISGARFAVRTADGRCIVPSVREERTSFVWLPLLGFKSRIERGLPVVFGPEWDPTNAKVPERWRFDVEAPDHGLTVPYRERDHLPAAAATMERRFNLDSPHRPLSTSLRHLRRDGTRRYQESTIEEGDEITVVGTLKDCTGENPVLTAPEDGRLIVSTLSPEALERRYRRLYHWYLYKIPARIVLATVAISAALLLAFGG